MLSFEVLAGVTLISDPKVLSIPVHENNDSWVDLRAQKAIVIGPSPEMSYCQIWCTALGDLPI